MPDAASGPIGVFAGVSMSTYMLNELLGAADGLLGQRGELGLLVGNDKDFAATRIAYRLGLTGPAVTVQTACSTGLSAVHMACRALQAGDCDTAIAAAASVRVPQRVGYLHQPGGIMSPTGRCRAFDANADGCVPASGVAAVVLRRLSDARQGGDHIEGIVLSTAMNNDGARKVGFAAPSVRGQIEVIRTAYALAEVKPRQVGYVEAHGTGTALGDPVEVAALADVFTGDERRCGIGSVKSNLGHLDAAAGLAGLIKATLAARHRILPPSINLQTLNSAIDLPEFRSWWSHG